MLSPSGQYAAASGITAEVESLIVRSGARGSGCYQFVG
jgi:hypothetical protein